MYKVAEVKALPDYKLWVKFSDGAEGTVDLSDTIGKGVFAKLQNENVFKSVFIDETTHTVAWPGEIDLCPDSLYAEIMGKDLSSVLNTEAHSVKA